MASNERGVSRARSFHPYVRNDSSPQLPSQTRTSYVRDDSSPQLSSQTRTNPNLKVVERQHREFERGDHSLFANEELDDQTYHHQDDDFDTMQAAPRGVRHPNDDLQSLKPPVNSGLLAHYEDRSEIDHQHISGTRNTTLKSGQDFRPDRRHDDFDQIHEDHVSGTVRDIFLDFDMKHPELQYEELDVRDDGERTMLNIGRLIGTGSYGVVYESANNPEIVYKIDRRVNRNCSNLWEYGLYHYLGLIGQEGRQRVMGIIEYDLQAPRCLPFVQIDKIYSIFSPAIKNKVMSMERLTCDFSEYIRKNNTMPCIRAQNYLNFTRISQQLISAFEYLHFRMTIHNDIKPANLGFKSTRFNGRNFTEMGSDSFDPLVEPCVCVFDMGMVSSPSKGQLNWQWIGPPIGTHPFSPPDNYFSQNRTPRGDLESLGYSLFCLLCDLPWKAPKTAQYILNSFELDRKTMNLPSLDPACVSPLRKRMKRNDLWGKGLGKKDSFQQGILIATSWAMRQKPPYDPKILKMIARYYSVVNSINVEEEMRAAQYHDLRDSTDFSRLEDFDLERHIYFNDNHTKKLIHSAIKMISTDNLRFSAMNTINNISMDNVL
jgi:serine/threonine protein kinase